MKESNKELFDFLNSADQETINKIKKYANTLKNKKIEEVVIPKNNINKNTDKYKITLKFINKILVNIGKEEIDDLTKFVNIDRADVIKEINIKTFEEMEVELLKYFDKYKFGWYRRSTTKQYILTFIREMCDDLGLLVHINKERISLLLLF